MSIPHYTDKTNVTINVATWEAFRQSGHTISTQITHLHCLDVAREKTFHQLIQFYLHHYTNIYSERDRGVSDLFNYIYSYLLIPLKRFAGQMSLK